MWRLSAVVLLTVVLSGCATTGDPPALPDPEVIFQDVPIAGVLVIPLPQPEDHVEVLTLPPVGLQPWARAKARFRQQRRRGGATPPAVQFVSLSPVLPRDDEEVSVAPPLRRGQEEKPEQPDRVLREAMRDSLVLPTRLAHFGGSAIARVPYHPDKVYQLVVSSQKPVLVILPPGERPAADPWFNEKQWQMLWVQAKDEDEKVRQRTLQIAPLLDDTGRLLAKPAQIALLMTSGRRFLLLLRPTTTLVSHTGITWDLGESAPVLESQPRHEASRTPGPALQRTASVPEPKVGVTRIHTAWHIEVTHGTPAWEPMTVWDDGEKVIIGFKTSLAYTAAPGVFAVNQAGKAILVESTPYENGDPRAPSYYLVKGLYSRLTLQDEYGQAVRLTRRTGATPPYREVPLEPLAR